MSNKKIAFIFPGQGAQYTGMGKSLYEGFESSKQIFELADKALPFSLSKICFQGSSEELARTDICQPAILTVSIAAFKALEQELAGGWKDLYKQAFFAGLSLGEYAALVASGSLDFSDAVRLVYKRGQFMQEASEKTCGSMACILGLETEKVFEICLKTNTCVANLNCPGQVVISGSKQAMSDAVSLAKEAYSARTIPLAVSGAFHSPLMQKAAEKLQAVLERVNLKTPSRPVFFNVTASSENDPGKIKDLLRRQVANSVLWERSVRNMASEGISEFIEVGPGKVLKGLLRKINPDWQVVNVEKTEDVAAACMPVRGQ